MSLSVQTNVSIPQNNINFKSNSKDLEKAYEALYRAGFQLPHDTAAGKENIDKVQKYGMAHRCLSGLREAVDLLKRTFKTAFSFKKTSDCMSSNRYKK